MNAKLKLMKCYDQRNKYKQYKKNNRHTATKIL